MQHSPLPVILTCSPPLRVAIVWSRSSMTCRAYCAPTADFSDGQLHCTSVAPLQTMCAPPRQFEEACRSCERQPYLDVPPHRTLVDWNMTLLSSLPISLPLSEIAPCWGFSLSLTGPLRFTSRACNPLLCLRSASLLFLSCMHCVSLLRCYRHIMHPSTSFDKSRLHFDQNFIFFFKL